MDKIISIPSSATEITPEWISKILNVKMSKEDFQLESNVQAGSGFLSSMIRLNCKSEDGKPYQLIIKILPEDPTMRALVISEGFDKTEINFYRTAMPDLVKILPDLQQYLCLSYYGHIQQEDAATSTEYASVLVLEDLKPQGYYSINFVGEVTPEQSQEILGFMAKFHFAGMALEEQKQQPLSKVYDFLQGSETGEKSMFYEMAKGGFMEIQGIFKEHGVAQNVIDAYESLALHSDRIINLVSKASAEFACLIHGDLWSANLLFNNKPQNHTKVIDWQLMGYKDPNYDIAVTIVSSIPIDQLSKSKVDEQLRHYYSTFANQCKDSKMEQLIRRDFESFSKFFYSWGMSYTFLWFLMSSDPFAANIPRLIKIYEFLVNDVKIHEFLLSQV